MLGSCDKITTDRDGTVIMNGHGNVDDRIKQLNQQCLHGFNTIKWDGQSESNKDVANGPYIYHFQAKSDAQIFEKFFKVAKLK